MAPAPSIYALRIKLPMIVPTIIVTIIFSIIGSLQLFSEPYLIQNLARTVINSHFTPNFYAYTLAFTGQQYNYSAAISFVLGGVVAVVSYAFMLDRQPRVDGERRHDHRRQDRASRRGFRRNRLLLTVVLGDLFHLYVHAAALRHHRLDQDQPGPVHQLRPVVLQRLPPLAEPLRPVHHPERHLPATGCGTPSTMR